MNRTYVTPRLLFLGLFLSGISNLFFSQSFTPISGIVNQYRVVTQVSTSACNSVLSMSNTSGFLIGDRVLVMQMKGATLNTSNTSSFGNVQIYAAAGSYEFASITAVSNSQLVLNGILTQNYDPSAGLQVIRVPQYTNVQVVNTLRASDWNGSEGGVVAISVTDTLRLSASIDVSGAGFRGGVISSNNNGSCGSPNTNFFYSLTSINGAEKGEGISELLSTMAAGKGKQANGGGGGNKHNSGGGGGGNLTSGGKGGHEMQGCTQVGSGGEGGAALQYVPGKVFMGGGGGRGDDNNNVGTVGTPGGGIVIIEARVIEGNGNAILANGDNQFMDATGIGDGSGGGGAGGAILLDVQTYSGSLQVRANGGDGGNDNCSYGCFGPGGGGGTGAIWISGNAFPANVVTQTQPGSAGLSIFPNQPCTGSTYGAQPGSQNTAGILTQLVLPEVGAGGAISSFLGPDTTLCNGETLLLNASIGTGSPTYVWQDGSTNATFQVTSPGTYWVEVNLGGCFGRDTIVVNYTSLPIVDLGPDTTICPNTSFFVDLTTPGAAYGWNDGLVIPGRTISQPGQYWVEVTVGGCSARDTLNVSLFNVQIPDLGPDQDRCPGQSITLNAVSLGASFVWQDGTIGSSYTLSSGGTYWVEATVNNCVVADTIEITDINPGNLELGPDTTLCDGESLTLNLSNLPGTFLWNTGATSSNLTISQPGVYWVEQSVSICTARDSIQVAYHPPIPLELGPPITACQGDQILLDAAVPGGTYLWSNGSTSPTRTATTTSTYIVTVTVGNCSLTDQVDITFETIPIVDLGPDTTICESQTLIFDLSADGLNYLWMDGGTTPFYEVKEAGEVWVELAHQCGNYRDSTEVSIEICECPVFMPSGFTPNGDGLNDHFGPTTDCILNDYSLEVFNRWGRRIFLSESLSYTWDGLYNGSTVPEGVYIWRLKYAPLIPGKEQSLEKHGSVTVIR